MNETNKATTVKIAKWRKLAVAAAIAVCMTACVERPREVIRTVELHYINGEVEMKVLRGSPYHQPRIKASYGMPTYNDRFNRIYGVVRFRVLRVDTLALEGGAL